MSEHEHLTDIKRDAVALWIAVAGADIEGQQNLVANTKCPSCLAIQTAVLGVILIADEPFLNDAGFLQMRPAELRELESALSGMRDALNGEQQ